MKDEKCRFFNTCPMVQQTGYTCRHDEEAKSYCGQFRHLDMLKFQEDWR